MASRLFAVILLVASSAVAQPLVPRPNYGEPNGTFPNWQERAMAQLVNRARVQPSIDLNACPNGQCAEAACYAVVAPVAWRYEFNQSARFHSATMGMFPFFAHDTPCVLFTDIASRYPGTSTGSMASSCSGSGTTPAFTRIGYFSGGAGGENIAAGNSSPFTTFYNQWLYETTGDSSCGFHANLDNGHRYNILTNGPALGVGYQAVGGSPYGSYWTQDFGAGGAIPKIPSGSHWTSVNHTRDPQGADTTVEFWANWYDGAAPTAATVVLDGVPHTMTASRGTTANGAYTYSAPGVSTACHTYYFAFTSSTLAAIRYPDTGTLGFGNSGCSDWQGAAPPPAVTNVVATALTATNVEVIWTGSCVTACRVYRSRFNDRTTFDLAGSGVSPFVDVGAAGGRAYLYKVRAFDGSQESADSNVNIATTTVYSFTPAPGGFVNAIDVNQTRDVVDSVRTLTGLPGGTYTYGSGSPSRISAGTVIHAADITEMRSNLDAAWFIIFGNHLSFTNNIVAGSSTVQAIDFNEIRGAVQ